MPSVDYVRGIVTDLDDPDHLGRVKVRYRWQGNSTTASEWAPVLRAICHTQGGGDWYLPDVEDEVLVCFEQGNRNYPIILGAYPSDTSPIPTAGLPGDANRDKENSLRFIKSNGGHLFAFGHTAGDRNISIKDDAGQELRISTDKGEVSIADTAGNKLQQLGKTKSIVLQNAKGHSLILKEKSTEIMHTNGQQATINGGKIAVKDQYGNEIEIGSNGIKLKASKKITLDSVSKVELDAKASVSLGAKASEALIKGTPDFMALINGHVHATADGASSPPNVPMEMSVLSIKAKTV